ncbi:hypothetical protein [Clostridium botulinum]|nr:hypothetical protein [Clostridium botulinum]APH20865.1 hypothetical protein NPD1_4354 [Clostridium botulinum]APQ71193.1 hypothetical protein RSJ8_4311 [Clostridium botulinum]
MSKSKKGINSYKIIENWDLNVVFDVIEINNDDLLESVIKITNIELV